VVHAIFLSLKNIAKGLVDKAGTTFTQITSGILLHLQAHENITELPATGR
jgi:hypothetical protein